MGTMEYICKVQMVIEAESKEEAAAMFAPYLSMDGNQLNVHVTEACKDKCPKCGEEGNIRWDSSRSLPCDGTIIYHGVCQSCRMGFKIYYDFAEMVIDV